MEAQDLFNLVLGTACAALGWFAKTIYAAVQELRRDLSNLHIELARDYVPSARFEEAVRTLHDKLDRVLERLNEKVDR
jgi:cell division protein FtsB